jgi:hypothetical protein
MWKRYRNLHKNVGHPECPMTIKIIPIAFAIVIELLFLLCIILLISAKLVIFCELVYVLHEFFIFLQEKME